MTQILISLAILALCGTDLVAFTRGSAAPAATNSPSPGRGPAACIGLHPERPARSRGVPLSAPTAQHLPPQTAGSRRRRSTRHFQAGPPPGEACPRPTTFAFSTATFAAHAPFRDRRRRLAIRGSGPRRAKLNATGLQSPPPGPALHSPNPQTPLASVP